jgi:hypothetical protein
MLWYSQKMPSVTVNTGFFGTSAVLVLTDEERRGLPGYEMQRQAFEKPLELHSAVLRQRCRADHHQ